LLKIHSEKRGIIGGVNKLIPFTQLSRVGGGRSLSNASVVVDDRGVPVGFFFGRDTFISLMTTIDEQFEKRTGSVKEAYDNFAGKIIDLVEEKLPVNPKFEKELSESIREAKEKGWVPFEQIKSTINA